VAEDLDPNLGQTIRDNASGPAKASNETGSVEQHPLRDQIEADRYLASKSAATNPRRALRLTKLVPPSATGGSC
jgi:hypothetical protein